MSHSQKRISKREQFNHSSLSSDKRTIVLVTLLVIVVGSVSYLVFGRNAMASAAQFSDGDVSIPAGNVGAEAKFFQYKTASNNVVKFFVIRSSDGVYRAAADACEVCYRDKQGYHQQGDNMVCRKCGRRFPSKDVNVVTGGCNPSGIPVRVQGENLVIAAADLNAHAVLF